jgi:hypothetical protein
MPVLEELQQYRCRWYFVQQTELHLDLVRWILMIKNVVYIASLLADAQPSPTKP